VLGHALPAEFLPLTPIGCRRCCSRDAQLNLAGSKDTLVGAILQPGAAHQLINGAPFDEPPPSVSLAIWGAL
jgi:hypothetical protein